MKVSLFLMLWAMPTPLSAAKGKSCKLRSKPRVAYTMDGEFMIGGTFPLHQDSTDHKFLFTERPQLPTCEKFSISHYMWALTMVFAIEEINQDQNLLPNLTLGFQILDTCLSVRRALQSAITILTGKNMPIINYHCQDKWQLAGIIADSSAARSIPTARLLGLSRHPQMSYFSTSILLSDKFQFPSFLCTVPSDDVQAFGIAQLVIEFGWTWVGILSTDNDLGEMGTQVIKKEFQKHGVCIAFHEIIPVDSSTLKTHIIIEVVKRSTANVIIVYANEPYRNPVLTGLSENNLTGKVWILISSGSILLRYTTEEAADMLSGAIGFEMQERSIPGLKEFLLRHHHYLLPNNVFAKAFWEEAFGCKWSSAQTNANILNNDQKTKVWCSGTENLTTVKNPSFCNPTLRTNYNIYNAVYMVAHALDDMASCVPGKGPFINNFCANPHTFKPWQLFHYMKNVHFMNKIGDKMSFVGSGDLYNIINLRRHSNGTPESVIVGTFNHKAPVGQQFHIDREAILWNMEKKEVPRSVCSKRCAPGYRKTLQPVGPACCFDCTPCSEGEISNETGSSSCWQCPSDQWPNEGRTACVPKTIEFLSTQEPLGATLTSVAVFSSFCTVSVLFIFVKHQHTAIVKANNRDLSYALLVSLVLSFLCSLLFMGEPQRTTCLLRQSAFGIIFVLCVSCVLAKTIMVVIAFNATKPWSNMRRWLGPVVPGGIVFGCTLGQVLICTSWLVFCPPHPEKDTAQRVGAIIINCNKCSETAFWCMLGYMGLVACVSFLVAFLARNLPDSFNEAKWITFSMLLFLIVWLSFIPGYLSTEGKYMMAVEVFGINSSSAGILVCIFIPKCYIILITPELNTRQNLLGKGASKYLNT